MKTWILPFLGLGVGSMLKLEFHFYTLDLRFKSYSEICMITKNQSCEQDINLKEIILNVNQIIIIIPSVNLGK